MKTDFLTVANAPLEAMTPEAKLEALNAASNAWFATQEHDPASTPAHPRPMRTKAGLEEEAERLLLFTQDWVDELSRTYRLSFGSQGCSILGKR